jgi:D-mannonate dehydratase
MDNYFSPYTPSNIHQVGKFLEAIAELCQEHGLELASQPHHPPVEVIRGGVVVGSFRRVTTDRKIFNVSVE